MTDRAIAELDELLSRPEGRWTLAEAALAIARIERPHLDSERHLDRLDEIARTARARIGGSTHPRFVAAAIAQTLYGELGMSCAREPDRSEQVFLDRALEGVPAAEPLMVLIFMEISRRCRKNFSCVALPGRLLLRRDYREVPHLFDPADFATPISEEQCRAFVVQSGEEEPELRTAFLRPITASQLVARMVAELKSTYWKNNQHELALGSVRMMLAIRPDDPREIRDLGRVQFLLQRYREAIASFEDYLSHNPSGEDADVVRMLIREAQQGLASSSSA